MQGKQALVQPVLILASYHAIHASRGGLLQVEEGAAHRVRRDVVQERSQFLPRLSRWSSFRGAVEGVVIQQVEVLSEELTVHLGSYGAGAGGNRRA